MRVPCSTYRLQFHSGFTLKDADFVADYLSDLGITDIYASPLTKACVGSLHGYDIVDPTQLNPELGAENDLRDLSLHLQSKNMGLVLDIVPNHMAASVENAWWQDVIRRGRESEYASYFDIDWSKKLLLPVLGRPYGDVLESGQFRVHMEASGPVLDYNGLKLPLTLPEDANLSNPEGLDRVLSHQPYRLAWWRTAAEEINYRRFFDISDLVGLQTEREDVFRATHTWILDLLANRVITGLRIDHIDGLRDPRGYLERLPPIYVVVEKILGGKESLPPDWRVWGTTGYDFLNIVNGLFVDREGYEELKSVYEDFIGSAASITDVFLSRKHLVMHELFAGEVHALTNRLVELARDDWHARDLSRHHLREALVNVTACLPIYRTYVRSCDTASEPDRYRIEDAVAAANRLTASPGYAFLRRVLLLEIPKYLEHRRCDWLDFLMRWQQFTGPVMAKGLEDTTFYVYNPLVSVNEVGGDSNGPETYFGIEEFHRHMQERRARWPFTMNAGSTHDTKRSEDVRTRINVLSELPTEWARCLKRWSRWNSGDTVPDANEVVLIYQTMLGAWPITVERMKQYITKALREAKVHTSWVDINEAYEGRVMRFIDRIFDAAQSPEFIDDFTRLQKKTAFYGALSSLSQAALRITAPGVPDFYQGTELWDYSLADPDNRRPVDFECRRQKLNALKAGVSIEDLLKNWPDGRLKMYVIAKALRFRRDHPDLFLRGEYIPLRTTGSRADNIVAFARRHQDDWTITIVPRLFAGLTRPGRWPTGPAIWLDTVVEFDEAGPPAWVNIFTGEAISLPLVALRIFQSFPLAILRGVR